MMTIRSSGIEIIFRRLYYTMTNDFVSV